MKLLLSLLMLLPGLCRGQSHILGLVASDSYQTNIWVGNIGTGDVDIWAVPTGKKVCIQQMTATTTNASTVFPQIKTNGVYYPFDVSSPITTNTTVNIVALGNRSSFVWVAGETVSVNSTAAGVNINLNATVLPDTWRGTTGKLLTLAVGENTLYTCPAGNKAVSAHSSTFVPSVFQNTIIVNRSGGARIYKVYFVKNGASSSTTNRVVFNPSFGNNVLIGYGGFNMDAGDRVIVDTDATTAGQTAYYGVYEFPVP